MENEQSNKYRKAILSDINTMHSKSASSAARFVDPEKRCFMSFFAVFQLGQGECRPLTLAGAEANLPRLLVR